jgi:hypothetical protein
MRRTELETCVRPFALAVVLGAALAAGPVLAQGTTTAPAQPAPGTGSTQATPGTPSAATNVPEVNRSRGGWAANSVLMHRPRLSQMIGANVYNENNEAIGEVDDILLSGGIVGSTMRGGTTGTTAGTAPMGTTGAGTTTTGTTTTGSTRTGSTGTGTTGTGTTGTTGTGSTTAGTGSSGTGTTGTTGSTGTAGSTTAMGTGTAGGTGSMSPGMGGMNEPVAVIQVGGFLGIGARLVTVPLSELQWNAERERVVMPNATKETLQSRPAFNYDSLRRG